jgi:inorganic pyrophosphatase
MAKDAKQGVSHPVRLSPRDPDDPHAIQVIIETPKGSGNKYAFDPEQRIFQLKKCCAPE